MMETTEVAESLIVVGDGSKATVREKVWDYLRRNKLALPLPVYTGIPNFKGSAEAAQKLSQLDVFKQASVIKISPDKPQEHVRLIALENHKTVLVPIPRLREGLFLKLNLPSDAKKQDLKVAASRLGAAQFGCPIGPQELPKVDLVVIGSVAVSEKGHRIGKGAGYADLEYAIMAQMGAVTEDTLVVTTVHDAQVLNDMPEDLFHPNDVPVDIIVTPTRVIHTSGHMPKPKGIMWNIVSTRRLTEMPVLNVIREIVGGEVVLKDVDSEPEEPRENGQGDRARRPQRRRLNSRRNPRHGRTDGEKSAEGGEGERDAERVEKTPQGGGDQSTPRPRRRRAPRQNSRGDGTDKENDLVGVEDRRRPSRNRPKPKLPVEFSLRVDKISPGTRVRDLKAALAERGVKPTDISWRGQRGFALLHFAKMSTGKEPVGVDSIVASLQDLRVAREGGGDSDEFLSVQPAKPITRIEVTDITAV